MKNLNPEMRDTLANLADKLENADVEMVLLRIAALRKGKLLPELKTLLVGVKDAIEGANHSEGEEMLRTFLKGFSPRLSDLEAFRINQAYDDVAAVLRSLKSVPCYGERLEMMKKTEEVAQGLDFIRLANHD